MCKKSFLLLTIFVLGVVSCAFGAGNYNGWGLGTGPMDNNWCNPNNWEGGQVPTTAGNWNIVTTEGMAGPLGSYDIRIAPGCAAVLGGMRLGGGNFEEEYDTITVQAGASMLGPSSGWDFNIGFGGWGKFIMSGTSVGTCSYFSVGSGSASGNGWLVMNSGDLHCSWQFQMTAGATAKIDLNGGTITIDGPTFYGWTDVTTANLFCNITGGTFDLAYSGPGNAANIPLLISSGKIVADGGTNPRAYVKRVDAGGRIILTAVIPNPKLAWSPKPADSAAPQITTNLSWKTGDGATGHKVYFGTDPNTMALIYTGALLTTTIPGSPLTYGEQYYWRVDEQGNGAGPGYVWSFTTHAYYGIDDMESYDADANDITNNWPSGTIDYTSGSTVSLSVDPVHGGQKAMQFDYDNTGGTAGGQKFSRTTRTFSPALNCTIKNAEVMDIWVKGVATNLANATNKPYAILYSGVTSQTIMLKTFDGNDIDVTDPNWQVARINLNTVTINKTSISKIAIGNGDLSNVAVGAAGTIFVDDIQLWVSRCLIMFTDTPGGAAHLHPTGDALWDCQINFKDIAVVANHWLQSGLWPTLYPAYVY